MHTLASDVLSTIHGGIPKLACQAAGAVAGGAATAYLLAKGQYGLAGKALAVAEGTLAAMDAKAHGMDPLGVFDVAAASLTIQPAPAGPLAGAWVGARAGMIAGARACGYTD